MHVGIMGGTFDPIHLGHLIAAEQAREAAKLDAVWFMPAHVPPHKKNAPLASPEDRLEMARLAVDGHPDFQVTDAEMRKGGVSYTVETMELLMQEHPNVQFSYIIGADMVQYLPRWVRIEELASRITFLGLARPGYKLDLSDLPDTLRSRVTIVEMMEVELSSTAIRTRLAEGRSVRYLLPDGVRAFIERRGLYAQRGLDREGTGSNAGQEMDAYARGHEGSH